MTRVYAGDGRPLAEFASEWRVFVPIEAIPKGVLDAFLSAEDRNFYSHHGIDPASILRAAITDVGRLRENRRPVGASTITQQVAKICSCRTRLLFRPQWQMIRCEIATIKPPYSDRMISLIQNSGRKTRKDLYNEC